MKRCITNFGVLEINRKVINEHYTRTGKTSERRIIYMYIKRQKIKIICDILILFLYCCLGWAQTVGVVPRTLPVIPILLGLYVVSHIVSGFASKCSIDWGLVWKTSVWLRILYWILLIYLIMSLFIDSLYTYNAIVMLILLGMLLGDEVNDYKKAIRYKLDNYKSVEDLIEARPEVTHMIRKEKLPEAAKNDDQRD